MTKPNTMTRANKVSIVPNGEGFTARFARTHREVAEIDSTETTWVADPKMNKTLQREMFRQWICEHSQEYNVEYDPEDRRTDENKMPSRYDSDGLLLATASSLVQQDVAQWIAKISEEHGNIVLVNVAGEEIAPTTKSSKGTDVNPKYNSGAWAWASIKVVTTVRLGDVDGYVTMECRLVSGQLKKPDSIGDGGYTFTAFKNELAKDIPALVKVEKTETTVENTTEKTEPKSKKGQKAAGK